MSKAWRQRMRNEGCCIDCGTQTDGHARCQGCRTKYAWTPAKSAAQRRMIAKRRAEGKCAVCRAPSKRYFRCLACRIWLNAYLMRKYPWTPEEAEAQRKRRRYHRDLQRAA